MVGCCIGWAFPEPSERHDPSQRDAHSQATVTVPPGGGVHPLSRGSGQGEERLVCPAAVHPSPPSRARTEPRNNAPASLPLAATLTRVATHTMVASHGTADVDGATDRGVCGARVFSPIYDGATPKTQPAMNTITEKYAPHQAHKHHYGWVRIYPVPSVLLSVSFVLVYLPSQNGGESPIRWRRHAHDALMGLAAERAYVRMVWNCIHSVHRCPSTRWVALSTTPPHTSATARR